MCIHRYPKTGKTGVGKSRLIQSQRLSGTVLGVLPALPPPPFRFSEAAHEFDEIATLRIQSTGTDR
jgi:hypothetical protein